MFLFDIETLGKKSSSVVLSFAIIQFNPEDTPSYSDLIDSAFFVKLDAEDQIKRLKRKVDAETVEWWKKQCQITKTKSVTPSADDVKAEDAIDMLANYVRQFPDWDKTHVWIRGNLDQIVFDDLCDDVGKEPVFHYSKWRDVRTAIDFLTESDSGYCDVDYPNFDSKALVIKHDPVHDCAYDIMMLIYGKKKGT